MKQVGLTSSNNLQNLNAVPPFRRKQGQTDNEHKACDTVEIGMNPAVHENGKARVIIEVNDPAKMEELKKDILNDPENRLKAELPLINSFAVELSSDSFASMSQLCMSDSGVRIFQDGEIRIIDPVEVPDQSAHIMMNVAGKTMNIDKVWKAGFKGRGVTIAIIDTGIAPHKDFKGRIKAFKDFVANKTQAYDDQGHGTHCAGIAAGNGHGSNGKYVGAAPEADLVGVKVLSSTGGGSFSDVVAGVQWVVENKDKLGINVVNMSLGGYTADSYKDSPVAMAVEAGIKKGLIFAVAAGNSGPGKNTVKTPGIAPSAITVGAMDDKGTLTREDDIVAPFSSRGPTKGDGLSKPDLITPGVNITATSNAGGYTVKSGTSMATPLAAGMIALVKQIVPSASPGEVKSAIMDTADKLKNYDQNTQGAGVFDILETVEKLTGKDLSGESSVSRG